jgi:uncharacterized protein DUF6683
MHAARTFRNTLLGFAGAAFAAAASAQMYSPDYGSYGAPMSNFISSNYLATQAGLGAVTSGKGGKVTPYPSYLALEKQKGEKAAALTLSPQSSQPIAPRKLAASYPPARRAQAEQFFLKTLEGYHQIEAKFGLRRNELAGAVATFVAGNWIAYRDRPFPDAHFRPLVEQMRGSVAGMPGLASASAAERQELYEQLAIIGTYMALTREALQKSPDPQLKAGMTRAARNYLEQFLRIDPDRIRIGPEGLVVN